MISGYRPRPLQGQARRAWQAQLCPLLLFVVLVLGSCSQPQNNTPRATATPPGIPMSTPAPTTPPPPPSSQELIVSDQQSGRLSEDQALLYRAYALFGDPRLPSQYQGGGSQENDPGLFIDAVQDWSKLSQDTQQQLLPFLVRPNQPNSLFNTVPTSAALAADAQMPAASTPRSAGHVPTCSNGWLFEKSQSHPFKVWAKCRTDSNAADQQALAVVGYMDDLWDRETSYMKAQPIPDGQNPQFDDGNDTSDLDIYMVDYQQIVSRGGQMESLAQREAGGLTPLAAPFQSRSSTSSSSYILIDRGHSGTLLESELAHEFFHVLQQTYNAYLYFGGKRFWFVDASATWAQTAFAHDALTQVYTRRFVNDFQQLHGAPPLDTINPYDAFIWPFFMYQQADSSIASVWKNLVGVRDEQKALDVMNAQVSFTNNLHIFGVRNLNSAFGGDNPLMVRYNNADETFPDEVMPTETKTVTELQKDRPVQQPFGMQRLSVRYFHYTVTDPGIKQVIFDFSKMLGFDVDAIVKLKGKPWKWLQLTGQYTVRFCASEGEDLQEIYLVITDHKFQVGAGPEGGELAIKPLSTPCTCDTLADPSLKGWQGTLTFTYSDQGAGPGQDPDTTNIQYTWKANHVATVMLSIKGIIPPSHLAGVASVTGGTASFEDTETLTNQGVVTTDTNSGSGPPFNPYAGPVYLNLNKCTYELRIGVVVSGGPNGGGQVFFLETGPLKSNNEAHLHVLHMRVPVELNHGMVGDTLYPRAHCYSPGNEATEPTKLDLGAPADVTWDFQPIT